MSLVTSPARGYTPDDLLRMPDGERYELVDGRLVERDMGWNASYIGGRIYLLLSLWCEQSRTGVVAPADAGYRCFADDPNKVRRPDVSFIRLDRLPPPEEREAYCHVAPDLTIEVVSPHDLYSEVEEKVAEYLAAGVRMVWVVNPSTRGVRTHRFDGTVTDFDESDELTCDDVLPGFRCRVTEFFKTPPGTLPTA